MKATKNFKSVIFLTLIICFISAKSQAQEKQAQVIQLDKNWTLQPSGEWTDDGKLITPDIYSEKNLIKCDVPTTVFAALVKNGKFSNPFFAENMERVPKEWFKTHWRFQKSFEVSKTLAGEYAELCFDGINYSADVFLNGQKIASADTLAGSFRRFKIDVTGILKSGENKLDVRVFPPKLGDFTMGFVDWTPEPPDNNMGIWRGVRVQFSGAVSIGQPFVISKINPENQKEAALTVESELVNHSKNAVKTILTAEIENITLHQEVELKPLEKKTVLFSPAEYKELNFKDAKLWWPVTMGEPNLYTLSLSCEVAGKSSDALSQTFGIREVSDYINSSGSRAYKVNGRDIQIRGGGWSDELLLRENADNLEAQVKYTKLMNLNCIRLEGIWGESEKLYDLCDKNGILLMVGWSCQWEWDEYVGKKCDKFGGISTPEEMALINRSLNDQVLWLRHHPSIFVWVLGSDKLPRPQLEKMYFNSLTVTDPTRPTLLSCGNATSEVSGPTAVKMNGPYDYVSPNYWYVDTKNGGAFGFNTETGPGPQIPVIESLRKMFPADKLWPVNDLWNYHSGRHSFNTIDNYKTALDNRYGQSQNIGDFERKAQLANYEAIRPMFESFAMNKAKAGGVIQWMLNASWPKLYWQLYDYYLVPTSAFFGTQSALKPLNIIYNYGDKNIYISNDYRKEFNHLTAEIKILDLNSKVVFSQKIPFEAAAYTSKKIFDLPAFKDISTTYFADLRIKSSDGKELSHSFYWLSTKEDVPDFPNSNWYITPLKGFADFTALQNLPKTELISDIVTEKQGDQTVVKVHLKNPGDKLAFFIGLKAKGKISKELITPVFWNDNYVSLLPGEECDLTATINTGDLKGDIPVIEISGMNTK